MSHGAQKPAFEKIPPIMVLFIFNINTSHYYDFFFSVYSSDSILDNDRKLLAPLINFWEFFELHIYKSLNCGFLYFS